MQNVFVFHAKRTCIPSKTHLCSKQNALVSKQNALVSKQNALVSENLWRNEKSYYIQ